jgi:hypothetical protein
MLLLTNQLIQPSLSNPVCAFAPLRFCVILLPSD